MASPHEEPGAPELPEQEDLLWYFNDAEGAMGLRSNYPAMVMQCLLGRQARGSVQAYELDETALDASTRRERIRFLLELAGEQATGVLRAAYTLPRPRKLLPHYGPLSALVLRCSAAHEHHRASQSSRTLLDWLSRLPRRGQEDLVARRALEAINAQAGQALYQAVLDYRAAQRKVARRG